MGGIKIGLFPILPDNYDEMPPGRKESLDKDHRFALRHCLYRIRCELHKERAKAMEMAGYSLIHNIIFWCTRCIAEGPIPLRAVLIQIQKNWKELGQYSRIVAEAPCPLDFTEEEIAMHEVEFNNWTEYSQYSDMLFSYLRADETGRVENEDTEWAMVELEECRKEWTDDELKGPFPIAEGGYSCHLV